MVLVFIQSYRIPRPNLNCEQHSFYLEAIEANNDPIGSPSPTIISITISTLKNRIYTEEKVFAQDHVPYFIVLASHPRPASSIFSPLHHRSVDAIHNHNNTRNFLLIALSYQHPQRDHFSRSHIAIVRSLPSTCRPFSRRGRWHHNKRTRLQPPTLSTTNAQSRSSQRINLCLRAPYIL
jgi:hypothetical protein